MLCSMKCLLKSGIAFCHNLLTNNSVSQSREKTNSRKGISFKFGELKALFEIFERNMSFISFVKDAYEDRTWFVRRSRGDSNLSVYMIYYIYKIVELIEWDTKYFNLESRGYENCDDEEEKDPNLGLSSKYEIITQFLKIKEDYDEIIFIKSLLEDKDRFLKLGALLNCEKTKESLEDPYCYKSYEFNSNVKALNFKIDLPKTYRDYELF